MLVPVLCQETAPGICWDVSGETDIRLRRQNTDMEMEPTSDPTFNVTDTRIWFQSGVIPLTCQEILQSLVLVVRVEAASLL